MRFSNDFEEMFYQSLRIRLVEEKIIQLYPSDKIQSPVHLSIGQEAVAVGACRSLKVADLLYCTYRSHAFYLAKGGDMKAMFAELYGKATGCCHGKGGSMHLAAPEVGLMGASAVVASTIPHGVGSALATKLMKKDQVIVTTFGDGAMDEGVYHESLNFAALHHLPVIFFVENNSLAVHSAAQDRHRFSAIEHAKIYGVEGTYVAAGYDFAAVDAAFSEVVAKVRRGAGPQLFEVKTFRYKEHVGVGDDFDAGYRSKQDFLDWQQKDPLCQNTDLVKKFQPFITQEIEAAVQFAEVSPWPADDQLLADVI